LERKGLNRFDFLLFFGQRAQHLKGLGVAGLGSFMGLRWSFWVFKGRNLDCCGVLSKGLL
jgi:hypothetical protein